MKSPIQIAIHEITEGNDLTREHAENVMDDVMSGKCTDAQIAAWLTGLRMKGETADEIAAGINVMRQNVL
ncbi:MAG: anthranilate phosphoribosyltransferase, partial [Lentisphaeraceae bacterium]|nr:anthranilate phosphoribosyltransferase [Lentisphaeraceae bacterium]